MTDNQVYVSVFLDLCKRCKKMELGQEEMELEYEEIKQIGEFRLDISKRFFALRVVSHLNILGHGPKPWSEFEDCLDSSLSHGLVLGSFVRSRVGPNGPYGSLPTDNIL